MFEHIAVRRYGRHVAEGKSTLLTVKNEVKQCKHYLSRIEKPTSSLKIEWLIVIGLAFATSVKEPTHLQRIKIIDAKGVKIDH